MTVHDHMKVRVEVATSGVVRAFELSKSTKGKCLGAFDRAIDGGQPDEHIADRIT